MNWWFESRLFWFFMISKNWVECKNPARRQGGDWSFFCLPSSQCLSPWDFCTLPSSHSPCKTKMAATQTSHRPWLNTWKNKGTMNSLKKVDLKIDLKMHIGRFCSQPFTSSRLLTRLKNILVAWRRCLSVRNAHSVHHNHYSVLSFLQSSDSVFMSDIFQWRVIDLWGVREKQKKSEFVYQASFILFLRKKISRLF